MESNVSVLTDEDLMENYYRIGFIDAPDYAAYARTNPPPERTLGAWFTYHPACRRVWIGRGLVPVEVMNSRQRPVEVK